MEYNKNRNTAYCLNEGSRLNEDNIEQFVANQWTRYDAEKDCGDLHIVLRRQLDRTIIENRRLEKENLRLRLLVAEFNNEK